PLSPPLVSSLFPYTTLFRSGVGFVDLRGFASWVDGRQLQMGRATPVALPHPDVAAVVHPVGLRQTPEERDARAVGTVTPNARFIDRKSTRLNSSHGSISYAV